LTPLFVQRVKPEARTFCVWDTQQKGLVLRVQRSGFRSYKVCYRFHGRPRWLTIEDARAITLSDARRFTAETMYAAACGRDPAAERKAERSAGTFCELVNRYFEERGKRKRSWQQPYRLIERRVMPKLGQLSVKAITRADIQMVIDRIESPSVANQTLAAVSVVFSWAVRMGIVAANACKGVEKHESSSRARIVGDGEMPLVWRALDDVDSIKAAALRTILLTGQRPGEVARMRIEHIKDGWWELPGKVDPQVGWRGTKNSLPHSVALPEPVREIIAEFCDGRTAGFVFAGPRGRSVRLDGVMKGVCDELNITDEIRAHDLRRTFGTSVTRLGYTPDAMDRLLNHVDGGVRAVYDRWRYRSENQTIWQAVAAHILDLVECRDGDNHSTTKRIRSKTVEIGLPSKSVGVQESCPIRIQDARLAGDEKLEDYG
jgi:integrase